MLRIMPAMLDLRSSARKTTLGVRIAFRIVWGSAKAALCCAKMVYLSSPAYRVSRAMLLVMEILLEKSTKIESGP